MDCNYRTIQNYLSDYVYPIEPYSCGIWDLSTAFQNKSQLFNILDTYYNILESKTIVN